MSLTQESPYREFIFPTDIQYTDLLAIEGRFDYILLEEYPSSITVYVKLDSRSNDLIELSKIRVIQNPKGFYKKLYLTTSGTSSGGQIKILVGGDAYFSSPAIYIQLQEVKTKLEEIFNSLGDAGTSPANFTGSTVLQLLHDVFSRIKDLGSHFSSWFDVNIQLAGAPIGANASYVESWLDMKYYWWAYLVVVIYSDVDGMLYVQQTYDKTEVDREDNLSYTGGSTSGNMLKVQLMFRYIRVRYVNGATAQTVFRLNKRYAIA